MKAKMIRVLIDEIEIPENTISLKIMDGFKETKLFKDTFINENKITEYFFTNLTELSEKEKKIFAKILQ